MTGTSQGPLTGDGLSLSPTQATTGPGGLPLPGTPGSGTTGTTPAGTPGGPASVPSGGPTAPGGGGGVLGSGRGFTAKEIRLGFSTSNDAGKALGAFGLGVAIADQEDLVKTWLAKVNREGGIAGRSVVPVFYDYKATGDTNTSDQAACQTWTQDTRVFAATGVRAGTTGNGDNLTPCLSKAGVPWLASSGDQHMFDQYLPTVYTTSEMNHTREERVLVESLAAEGILTKSAKVGVIINDTLSDMSRAVKEAMEPALARLGLTITKRVVIANAFTESTNAELQMYASGVTHVLFAAPGGAAASQFMSAAQSQRHTYQYGVSTQDAPGIALQALAPPNQLKNAHGYGYAPGRDVDSNNQPAETPAMKSCFDYYRSKGYDTGGLNRSGMALICDSVGLLREAFRNQTALSLTGLVNAVAGFGTRLQVASTFTSRFTARQHDGVGSYRYISYVTDCSCFRYTGALRTAS
jgi:hypothetical protein